MKMFVEYLRDVDLMMYPNKLLCATDWRKASRDNRPVDNRNKIFIYHIKPVKRSWYVLAWFV